MHIIIGDTPPVGPPARKGLGRNGGTIEAKVLDVRPPRRRQGEKVDGQDRRKGNGNPDPVHGKVLVLLAAEGYNIPDDVRTGNYRVFVKFAPR